MDFRLALLGAAAAFPAACATSPGRERASVEVALDPVEEWRSVATTADAAALDSLRPRWEAALTAARTKGFSRRIATAGELLDPGAALPRPAPGPGAYRCTLYRLGPAERRAPAFSASREAYCFVGVGTEEDRLSLTTELPGRRVGGHLWEQAAGRALVFLGAEIGKGLKVAPRYGDPGSIGAAGLVERVGDLSYRLVLPEPGGGVHIIAMTAAPPP
jgi:hypothetical protein